MARGIVRLDPKRVLETAGLAGYGLMGATYTSGQLILVVEGGDAIPAVPKQLVEIPAPGAAPTLVKRAKKRPAEAAGHGDALGDDEDNHLNDLQLK